MVGVKSGVKVRGSWSGRCKGWGQGRGGVKVGVKVGEGSRSGSRLVSRLGVKAVIKVGGSRWWGQGRVSRVGHDWWSQGRVKVGLSSLGVKVRGSVSGGGGQGQGEGGSRSGRLGSDGRWDFVWWGLEINRECSFQGLMIEFNFIPFHSIPIHSIPCFTQCQSFASDIDTF